MVTLVRESPLSEQEKAEYRCNTGLAPLKDIVGRVQALPPSYVDTSAGLVTDEYLAYARPLVGAAMPRYARIVGPRARR